MDTRFKKLFIPVAILAVCFLVVPALPGDCCDKDKKEKDPNIGHLYLCEKTISDPSDPSELNVPCDTAGKAWGKMKYNKSGPLFEYVFNGHGLVPGQNYTLIYFPDPYRGSGLIYFGSDTAKGDGEVHIKGSLDTGDLPAPYDYNNFYNEIYHHPWITQDNYGARIWLVLSSDLCIRSQFGSLMRWWQPDQYLFEENLIMFEDTDAYGDPCQRD
jgi:hypothetical protein